MNGPPQRRQSAVGALSIHKRKHYTKREYADDRQVNDSLKPFNMTFSEWDLIITNTVEKDWYRKADRYIARDAAADIFPTMFTPGVYEIALVHTSYFFDSAFQEHIVVYAGFTNHLRQRILHQYGKDGSKLHYSLRPFLEAGFQVYFRWAYAPFRNATIARNAETALLGAFDYAMAKSKNPPSRDAIWTPQMRVDGATVRMVTLIDQKVSTLSNLADVALQIKQEAQEADAAAADLAAEDESVDSAEEDDLDYLYQKFLALSIEKKEKFRVSIASTDVPLKKK